MRISCCNQLINQKGRGYNSQKIVTSLKFRPYIAESFSKAKNDYKTNLTGNSVLYVW